MSYAAISGFLRAELPPRVAATASQVAERFAPELDGYAEAILGPRAAPVGFMTRGEGDDFTARVADVLRGLDVPPASLAHHARLAADHEHKRAFFKVEWHADGDRVAPLAACYFRRRPAVDTVLERLAAAGVAAPVLDEVRALAAALDKRTIHFVSAAFRPAHELQHKLYFSQLCERGDREAVEARIGALVAAAGHDVERWRALHRRSVGSPGEGDAAPTIFVSFNLTASARVPSFKIDYPLVSPALAAAWAAPAERERTLGDATRAARAVGHEYLAYLGVRYDAGAPAPRLKYYADS